MAKRLLPFLVLGMSFLFGCDSVVDRREKELAIKERLKGEWLLLREPGQRLPSREPWDRDWLPFPMGLEVGADSIEFFKGFFHFDHEKYSFGKNPLQYLGNFAPYKVEVDNILFKHPDTGGWDSLGRFVSLQGDTLKLIYHDSVPGTYLKIRYDWDTIPDFDQIIYYGAPCYGSCPIQTISLTRDGEVHYYGYYNVKPLGVFTGKLDSARTAYVFSKFRKAMPMRRLDEYPNGPTDQKTILTSFIRDGRIVKTIYDYGDEGPIQLDWAYLVMANLTEKMILDTVPVSNILSPWHCDVAIDAGNGHFDYKWSDYFFLWTELMNSSVTKKRFMPKYKVISNIVLWENEAEIEPGQRDIRVPSVETDGQFFRFKWQNGKSITYDLGYDFLDRNPRNIKEVIHYQNPDPTP